ncbi:glutathionylspermidine synthase family protein [Paenibacillus rigui]|uniref:Glutathionylspermidine synthase n=1 Tax=Paenibacillus rigui TaxID=554312 RepID=A0A229URM2_9BACL|nr:glutathionylspermidine synthase family protein [Paenibacillus rigui]OXM85835.1 glutathionylspermidine synthase [Paenibacillus rigui]
MTYRQNRTSIYDRLQSDGVFTWDHIDGEEYALASVIPLSDELHRQLHEAALGLSRLFKKTLKIVQQNDQLLLQLGIPEAALETVKLSMKSEAPTVVGRFDFANTPEGLKMLELNSDSPTSVVEAYYVNGVVCDHYGYTNPNRDCGGHIEEAFSSVFREYQEQGYACESIFFTALGWHEEDAGTTRYLLQQSKLPGRFIDLSSLRVYEDRLCALEGEEHVPVDMLYRLHALEKLAMETDTDGYPTGAHALDLVARRKTAIINPPEAFIVQSKAFQALVWGLHEAGEFYTAEEHALIQTYMLPTYLENKFIGRASYVTKPIYGREGGGVTIFDQEGDCAAKDEGEYYWEQPMVYQQFAEMERICVETLKGETEGYLLWGTFIMGGQPSAVVARLGNRITDNNAYFLPIRCEKD